MAKWVLDTAFEDKGCQPLTVKVSITPYTPYEL